MLAVVNEKLILPVKEDKYFRVTKTSRPRPDGRFGLQGPGTHLAQSMTAKMPPYSNLASTRKAAVRAVV
jgi:hypothetical protein